MSYDNDEYFKQNHPDLYQQLLGLRTNYDDLNIQFKQIVKQRIIADPRIIYVLHNDDLDCRQPDDYLNVNVLSRVNLPEVQSRVKTTSVSRWIWRTTLRNMHALRAFW